MQASVVHAAEDTLSQARASSNPDQLNAVSAFNSGQSELSTGPTFYPNRTTERPNDQLQHVAADQSDSLRPTVKAGMHARTQLGLYRKSVHGW